MTYDIALFQPPITGVQYIPALVTPSSTGRYLTGAEKLAQRFLLELMTIQGSMQFAPDSGCDFLERLGQGGIFTEADVIATFSKALVTVTDNLQMEESSIDPDNERFITATIANILLADNLLILVISIMSRDNSSTILSIPLGLFDLAG